MGAITGKKRWKIRSAFEKKVVLRLMIESFIQKFGRKLPRTQSKAEMLEYSTTVCILK